ncbi:MAG: phosphotransferase family protein [Acidimicrobiia bacterium]
MATGSGDTGSGVIARDGSPTGLVVQWLEANVGGTVSAIRPQARWRPMWYVDLERDGENVELVVRSERPDVNVFPLDHEMRLHRTLNEQGIPIPKVHGWMDRPRAYVMDRVEGRPDFDGVSLSDRDAVVDDYLQVLVRMHSLDVTPFVEAGIVRAERPEDQGLVEINQLEQVYRQHKNRPNPFAEFGISWVRRHRPITSGRQSAVVWDSGQFMHCDGRLVSIIDVELGHISDPMVDLAGWRQRESVLRCGDFNALYARYGELSGEAVDMRSIQLFHIASTLWNELPFAHTFRHPQPGVDYMTNLQWANETNLYFTEGVYEYLDLEPPTVEVPEPTVRQVSGAHHHLVRTLRELEHTRHAEMGDDGTGDFVHGDRRDVLGYKLRTTFRLARHLERYMEIGDAVERADLDDLAPVLGHRPDNWLEGEAQLEQFVIADAKTGEHDLALLDLFHKRLTRAQMLNGPLGSAMARHNPIQMFRS